MNEHEKIWRIIDDILWNDWDPIGINDVAPRDEYRSYVPAIQKLVSEKRNSETIAQELDRIASKTIGVGSNLSRSRAVAKKIIECVENATQHNS